MVMVGLTCKNNRGCSHSLDEALVHQIRPVEVVCIVQLVDVALLDLQGQVVHDEERTAAATIVCVQPQLIQAYVMNHTHLCAPASKV